MNPAYPFAAPPWIDALGFALLHSLWIVAALAALAALMFAVWPDAAAKRRHTAGLLILLTMVALPVGVFAVTLALTLTEHATPTATRITSGTTTPPALVGGASLDATAPALPLTSFETTRHWTPWAVLAWSAGVCLGSLRLVFGGLGVWRLKRRAVTPCDALPAERLAVLHERIGLKRLAPVLVSARATSACVAGWVRPAVLLPVAVVRSLTPVQLEAIVLHELAHLARRDPLLNALQCVAETLLFFHPAAWWLSAKVRDERERACDDVVATITGDAPAYARALLAAADAAAVSPPTFGVFAMASHRLSPASSGSKPSRFRGRLARLAGVAPAPRRGLGSTERLLAACLTLTAAGMVVVACTPTEDGGGVAEIEFDARPIRVNLEALLSGDDALDVAIHPGDVVHIVGPQKGFIYLMGDINRPGTYSIPGERRLTVKQALASAGGLNGRPGLVVDLVRRVGAGGEVLFRENVKDIYEGKAPDAYLAAEDLLNLHVPTLNENQTDPTYRRFGDPSFERIDAEGNPRTYPQPIVELEPAVSNDPFATIDTRTPTADDLRFAGPGTFEVRGPAIDGVLKIGRHEIPADVSNYRLLNALAAVGGVPDQTRWIYIERGAASE